MRKLFNYVLVLLAVTSLSLSFASCSSDDDAAASFDTPKFEQEAAKYVISGNNSSYSSIELTASGNYIIVQTPGGAYSQVRSAEANTPAFFRTGYGLGEVSFFNGRNSHTRAYSPILYGTYEKIGEYEYELKDFGKIKVIKDGSGNAYSIEVTKGDGSKQILTASKQNADLNSDMSNKLCRTWGISKLRMVAKVNGETLMDVSGKSFKEFRDNIAAWAKKHGVDADDLFDTDDVSWPEQVVFTKSGTYMVYYSASELAVSSWKWQDENKGILMYSWDNDFDADGWDGLATITFSGKECIITEAYTAEGVEFSNMTYLVEAK